MDRFRFQNAELQDRLQRLYAAAGIPHEIASEGALVCEETFAASAEALRSAVRSQRFADWHTYCVSDDAESGDEDYQKAVLGHLAERAIPFELEEHNSECWILLSEDETIPDSIWESVYGSVSTYARTNPPCCFCDQEIEGEAFGEISIRRPEGAFRSVLYSHLDCLRAKVPPQSLHIIDSVD
jgi:hypothetical protein